MNEIQHYAPVDDPVLTIELAPVPVKSALAKQAWDGLPLERRTGDNLTTLRNAISQNPQGFLELCHREGLQVDLSVVVNHTENHYHSPPQPPQPQGLSAADIVALAQAMQPQNPSLTASDVAQIVQSCLAQQPQPQPTQVVYQGFSERDLVDYAQEVAEIAVQRRERYYEPEPPQYWHQPAQIVINNEIHGGNNTANSHSQQDIGNGAPLILVPIALLLCLFGIGIGGGQ